MSKNTNAGKMCDWVIVWHAHCYRIHYWMARHEPYTYNSWAWDRNIGELSSEHGRHLLLWWGKVGILYFFHLSGGAMIVTSSGQVMYHYKKKIPQCELSFFNYDDFAIVLFIKKTCELPTTNQNCYKITLNSLIFYLFYIPPFSNTTLQLLKAGTIHNLVV